VKGGAHISRSRGDDHRAAAHRQRDGRSRRWVSSSALVLELVVAPHVAFAERPLHGSLGAGGTLLLAGGGSDRARGELVLDVEPWSRFGALIAWRGFDTDHAGLVTAGLAFEAGAARPRLVLDLHGDIGADLDQRAPAVGGGVRALLVLVGPLGLAIDSGAYLVIDGVDHTRLAITVGGAVTLAW
jgi:hypothetical protein